MEHKTMQRYAYKKPFMRYLQAQALLGDHLLQELFCSSDDSPTMSPAYKTYNEAIINWDMEEHGNTSGMILFVCHCFPVADLIYNYIADWFGCLSSRVMCYSFWC